MNKRSILVVDNDRSIREYLATFLAARGHTVECFGSGDETIERLASGFSPSLMMLDIMLPGKDGLEVL